MPFNSNAYGPRVPFLPWNITQMPMLLMPYMQELICIVWHLLRVLLIVPKPNVFVSMLAYPGLLQGESLHNQCCSELQLLQDHYWC